MASGFRVAIAGLVVFGSMAVVGCGIPVPGTSPTITSAPAGTPTSLPPPPTSAAPPTTNTPKPSPSRPTGASTSGRPTRSSVAPTTRTSPGATSTTGGPCALPSALLGRDLTILPGAGKVAALTFDAGGDGAAVDKILAVLAEREAPATFFFTGRFAAARPATARRIAARYPVGNHTQDHLDLTKVSLAKARAQLREGAATITAVTGQEPGPYFRFPMGAVTPALVRMVNQECYLPVRWTIDTLGWQGTDPDSSSRGMTAAKVVQRVVSGLRPGAIVLMHVGANPDDHTTLDADALPEVIDQIRSRGYRLVDLTVLAGA